MPEIIEFEIAGQEGVLETQVIKTCCTGTNFRADEKSYFLGQTNLAKVADCILSYMDAVHTCSYVAQVLIFFPEREQDWANSENIEADVNWVRINGLTVWEKK